jgi:hypothetical protein
MRRANIYVREVSDNHEACNNYQITFARAHIAADHFIGPSSVESVSGRFIANAENILATGC